MNQTVTKVEPNETVNDNVNEHGNGKENVGMTNGTGDGKVASQIAGDCSVSAKG